MPKPRISPDEVGWECWDDEGFCGWGFSPEEAWWDYTLEKENFERVIAIGTYVPPQPLTFWQKVKRWFK